MTQKITLITGGSRGLGKSAAHHLAKAGMMKGGIEVFTRFLAKELAPRRIRVNAPRTFLFFHSKSA